MLSTTATMIRNLNAIMISLSTTTTISTTAAITSTQNNKETAADLIAIVGIVFLFASFCLYLLTCVRLGVCQFAYLFAFQVLLLPTPVLRVYVLNQ